MENKKTNQKSKNLSFSFKLNLDDPTDYSINQTLDETINKINSFKYGKKFKKAELIKYFITKVIDDDQLKDIKKQTLTQEEKLKQWHHGYQKKNNTQIEKMDFIVNIMPKLKSNDFKKLEKVVENEVIDNGTIQ